MPTYNGEYEDVIRPFVDAMRYKMANNKHKGERKWVEMAPSTLLSLIEAEVKELEEAIARGNTTEIMLEAADIANFCMMVANVAVNRAVKGEGSDTRTFTPASLPNTATWACVCGWTGRPQITVQISTPGVPRYECPNCNTVLVQNEHHNPASR